MRPTIALTGGSGFIGFSLARYLAKYFNIRILDIRQPDQALGVGMSFQVCNVKNFEEVKKSLMNVDIVIHLAIIQIPTINDYKRLGYEVNIIGTQNVCKAVDENQRIKGMILASSWHTMGERGLKGIIDEEISYNPDRVEDRAKLYTLSKIAQEVIVRFYDRMSDKIYGIIRLGTVLGEGMSEKTAANIFIEKGLRGEPITPYKHSMYRPMLYVDMEDVCKAFKAYVLKILKGEIRKEENDLAHIVNVFYPEPITILELAEIVREAIIKYCKIRPRIEIIDLGIKSLFTKNDKKKFKVDISKCKSFLGLTKLKSPKESIEHIVKARLSMLKESS